MNFQMTDKQKIAQDVAKEFAAEILRSEAGVIDQDRTMPQHIIEKMAESSLCGVIIPEAYGGIGLNTACLVVAVEEIAMACPSLGVVLAAHSIVSGQVMNFGSDRIKNEILPKMAAGSLGGMAITEPNASSNLLALGTTGTPVGSGFKLNGTKVYTSNSDIASYFTILFKSSSEPGPGSLTFALVDSQVPGLSKGRKEHLMGLGGDSIQSLSFKDMAVEEGRILGQVGGGLAVAQATVGVGYLCVAATAVGASRELLRLAMQYAKQRDSGFGPISSHSVVQQYVAEMSYLVEASQLLVHRAASERDSGSKNPLAIWQSRVFAVDCAKRVASLAQLIYGSYGFSEEYPVSRYVRDISGLQFIFGNQDLIRGNLGKFLFDQG